MRNRPFLLHFDDLCALVFGSFIKRQTKAAYTVQMSFSPSIAWKRNTVIIKTYGMLSLMADHQVTDSSHHVIT